MTATTIFVTSEHMTLVACGDVFFHYFQYFIAAKTVLKNIVSFRCTIWSAQNRQNIYVVFEKFSGPY